MKHAPTIVLALLLACGTKAKSDRESEAPRVDTAATDPCSAEALGLPNATKLMPFLVRDCTVTGTALVKSDDEARERVACAVGKVDWKKYALVATRRMLSPATTGYDAFDDGKTITFVGRQRSPCPNDPRPMPIESTLSYLVPAGGDRAFADRACTVPTKCP